MPIIVPARLQRRADGVPVSEIYDDIYHSDSGGLAQARQVFLAGNGLPERWQGRQAFSILETGFGLGLNFLTTFAAWQADAERCAQLHFTSIEKHPFAAADLAVAHAAWPDLASQSAELCSHWPELRPGMHRVELAGGRVVLHLVFSDATALLGDEQAGDHLGTDFDAFYLDGFAPMKNPELWSPALCRALARRAAADATLATWSVAGRVRRALADAGFAVRKVPGFGSKRQMLVGSISKPIDGLLP